MKNSTLNLTGAPISEAISLTPLHTRSFANGLQERERMWSGNLPWILIKLPGRANWPLSVFWHSKKRENCSDEEKNKSSTEDHAASFVRTLMLKSEAKNTCTSRGCCFYGTADTRHPFQKKTVAETFCTLTSKPFLIPRAIYTFRRPQSFF